MSFRASHAALFDRLVDAPGLTFLRPDKVQCDDDLCLYVRDDLSLFADSNHLAQPALPLFAPVFEGILKNRGTAGVKQSNAAATPSNL